MNDYRMPIVPVDPSAAPTINRQNFQGYAFTGDTLERINYHIEEIRDNFDLPFDELYHKEKKLVDAVIKATQALRAKEATLPDPMGAERTIEGNDLKGEYIGEEYQADSQFIRDQRRKSKRIESDSNFR